MIKSYFHKPLDRLQKKTPIAHSSLYAQSGMPRVGRCSFSCLPLLLVLLSGLFLGALGTLFYISFTYGASTPPSQSVPGEAAIVVQLSPTYLSQIATKEVSQASIPGSLKNIQVTMAHNTPITISGDDQIDFKGFEVTKNITIQIQPVIRACQLQVSITYVALSGIPVTFFVSSFEQLINQQLSNNSNRSSLPQGFTYCVTNVHTETNGIFVTYSATPV